MTSLNGDDYEARYASGFVPWDSDNPSPELVRLLDASVGSPQAPGVHEHQLRCELLPLFELLELSRFQEKLATPRGATSPAWSILLRRP